MKGLVKGFDEFFSYIIYIFSIFLEAYYILYLIIEIGLNVGFCFLFFLRSDSRIKRKSDTKLAGKDERYGKTVYRAVCAAYCLSVPE